MRLSSQLLAACLVCHASACTEVDPNYDPPVDAIDSGASSTGGPPGTGSSDPDPGTSTTDGVGSTSATTSVGGSSGGPATTTGPTGCAADPDCPWWDPAWAHRIRLDVDPGATLQPPLFDVPLMVALDGSRVNLDDFADGGSDIRFVTEFDEPIASEVDTWNIAGRSVLWVNIPTFDGEPFSLYMYYGNQEASGTSTGNPWSPDYRAVWHLGPQLQDSTPAALALTDVGGAAADGALGEARRLDGGGDRLEAGTEAALKVPGDVTISMWFRMTSISDSFMGNPLWVSAEPSDDGDIAEWLGFNEDGTFVASWSRASGNEYTLPASEPAPIQSGVWHHMTFVRSGSDFFQFYLDGQQIGDDRPFGDTPIDLPLAVTMIGADPRDTGDSSISATVDEVRILGRAASPEWVDVELRAARDELITYNAVEDVP